MTIKLSCLLQLEVNKGTVGGWWIEEGDGEEYYKKNINVHTGEKKMKTLWEVNEESVTFGAKYISISSIFGGSKDKYLPYARLYSTLDQEQLLSLIQSASENKWEILDLSNASISELPDELWELTSLKVLFLGNDIDAENINKIRVISDKICKLVNLEALSICGLQNIKISRNVRKLPKLVYVDCFGCKFEKFPQGLFNKRITSIGIDCENEEVFNRVCDLSNLKELFLTWSKLTRLPEAICNLKKLETLFLKNTDIKEIPNTLCNMRNIKYFCISNTPLAEEIPQEILKQSALDTISYICKQQAEDREYYCNESKMIIVGQGNVGKSCLLERICENQYREKESTEGIAIRKWTYADAKKQNTYVLNIWDFGGQEIYHSTHQFFLTKRSLYIFVWDARAEEEYGRIDYWLKTIESFAEDSPIIIAINKCDVSTTRVNRICFEEYKEKYPQIKTILDISCKDNINIPVLRNRIKREAKKLPIMKIKWFYEWYQIRMRLERLAEKRKYIDYSDYRKICVEYRLEDQETKSLSKYLHDLGIILHYEDDLILRGIIILSPEWVTEAVYKILDSQETVLKNRNGILKVDDLPVIWKNQQTYPEDKYVFLLKIMEKFQLCFEVTKGEYLIAELLENTVIPMPEKWDFTPQDTIKIIYEYDFMPAGVMTRFIVSANQYLANDKKGMKLCWKKGAYLKHQRAYASVVMIDSISEKKIEVRVNKNGSLKDATELLHLIRQKLREINGTFKKLNVKEYVPCNCNNECSFKFEYLTLCLALEKGKETIECHKSFEDVNILRLLEGIDIEKNERNNSMYSINIENSPEIKTNIKVDSSNTSSQEQFTNVKTIKTNLNEIQGFLQELSEEMEDMEEEEVLQDICSANRSIEALENTENASEILKSGKLNKIRRLIEGFATEDGEYRNLISGSRNIGKIVGGLIAKFNSLATMLGVDNILH